jgi:hypothetical protein
MLDRPPKLRSLSKGPRRLESISATLLISDFVLAFQCITSHGAVAAKGWTATGLELVNALRAAIFPSCAPAKVFSHYREGRNDQAPPGFGSRSHHAGIYRRRVAFPHDAWGRGRMREFYQPIGVSDSVFWFFALIGIVARRVFWFALVFAGALICFLMAW